MCALLTEESLTTTCRGRRKKEIVVSGHDLICNRKVTGWANYSGEVSKGSVMDGPVGVKTIEKHHILAFKPGGMYYVDNGSVFSCQQ